MTQQEKVWAMAEFWSVYSRADCEEGTGPPYPDDVLVIADGQFLIVATLDPGKDYQAPRVLAWDGPTAAAWHDNVMRFRKDNPGCYLWEAVFETMPGEIDH